MQRDMQRETSAVVVAVAGVEPEQSSFGKEITR